MLDCRLRSRSLQRTIIGSVLVAAALGACSHDVTAPGSARSFALAPVFPKWFQQSPDSAQFTSVRAALTNILGMIVADTTVAFPASADSIALQFPLPDSVAITGEPLMALVWCINTAGDTVFKGGPVPVIVGSGRSVSATVIPLTYVGGGSGRGGGGGVVASALAIATQPVTTVAGSAVALTVDAVDAAGAIVTSFTGPVALALGANPASATLGGTLTANAVNGVATFSNVLLTKAASAYTLVATASALTSATSQAFNINPGAASTVTMAGGNNQSGPLSSLLGTPLSVLVHDAYGNPVPGVNVVWAAASGSGSLANSTTQTDASGVATDGWTLGSVAGAQTVTATAAGLASSALTFTATATSGASGVTKLVMSAIPSTVTAGSTIAQSITVTAEDAAGAVVSAFTGAVLLALGANPGGGTLGGTTTANAVSGVATFTNIVLTKAASGYTLVASDGRVTSAASSAFSIVAGSPSVIAITGGNNQSGILSALLGTPLSVLVHDAYGNPVSGVNVAWAAASGGGSLANATTATNSGGVATDTWTLGSLVGIQTATATAAGLASAPVTFTATATALVSTVTKLVLSAIPSSIVAGSAIAQSITVTAEDATGAVVSSFVGAVQLALGANPGGGALGGTTTANAVNGVATFSNAVVTKAGGGYTLVASGDGLTSPASSAFAITPGAASVITKQGGDNQSGILGALLSNPLSVLVTDAYGNPVSGATVNWVVSAGDAALASTSSTTNGSGIATNSLTLLGLVPGVSDVTASLGSAASVVFSATSIL